MRERLTEVDLTRMRADHAGHQCDAALLLTELDERNSMVRGWQGRNHRRPDPWQPEQDAAVAMGLMGPVSSEELERDGSIARKG